MKTRLRFVFCLALGAEWMVLLACSHKPEEGRQIFEQQCSECHNADSSDRKMGPGLKGLFQHERLASNGKRVTEANVRTQIDKGGNGMPSFEEMLNNKDKEDVIAYLRTL